jgi:hypothetical protein
MKKRRQNIVTNKSRRCDGLGAMGLAALAVCFTSPRCLWGPPNRVYNSWLIVEISDYNIWYDMWKQLENFTLSSCSFCSSVLPSRFLIWLWRARWETELSRPSRDLAHTRTTFSPVLVVQKNSYITLWLFILLFTIPVEMSFKQRYLTLTDGGYRNIYRNLPGHGPFSPTVLLPTDYTWHVWKVHSSQ